MNNVWFLRPRNRGERHQEQAVKLEMPGAQLPDAKLIRTRTFAELWVSPAQLTAEISNFLDRVWAEAGPEEPYREAV